MKPFYEIKLSHFGELRVIQGAVQTVLSWGRGVYSAPTRCCQLMLDYTSVVKGVGMMYKSCGVVSLINSSIFLGIKHNFVNTPKPDHNHLKSKYSQKNDKSKQTN